MNYYALVGLFNGVVVLFSAAALSFRKPRINHYKSFLTFSLSVGLWSVFYAVWQMQTTHDAALLWMRVAMLLIYPSCFGFLWFVMEVCGVQISKALRLGLIVTPAILMIFAFSSLMVKDVGPQMMFPFWPVPGTLMCVYSFLFCSCVFVSFLILSLTWHSSVGAHRWQIKWIIFTMAPAWVGGSTNWLLWFGINFPPAPNFFVGVGWLLLAYAMVRTRLFDADVLADYVQEARLSAIGLLTSSIHHEIKSPVFVIRGLAEGLAEKEVDKNRVLETTTKIVEQTERITAIIKKFRDFATRPKNKLMAIEDVETHSTVKAIMPMLQNQLEAGKIQLDNQIEKGITVKADAYALEEILLNLILNACQALKNTPHPKITLTGSVLGTQTRGLTPMVPNLSLGSRSSVPGLAIAIAIADNGPGIPQKDLPRLFEPFYTTKKEGTGLGLYVVKQLVERNHAEIRVSSKVGEGTRFTIFFKS